MPVEQYAKILGELKPGFIHHPEVNGISRMSCSIWAVTLLRPISMFPR
jgi:hypothetical protein